MGPRELRERITALEKKLDEVFKRVEALEKKPAPAKDRKRTEVKTD